MRCLKASRAVLNDLIIGVLLCRISSSDLKGITCLPLNMYSIVQSSEHGELLVEAGLLQKDKRLHVAQQRFVEGRCAALVLGSEKSA